ncbi:Flp pilus assembly protein CpaB [Tissierella praeacuta]|uniref:Flp pilus assembly protein CpaB n=1 Tax=Tissierella praeacuta TaxID=43131 RepID=UPI003DA37A4F
MQIKRFLKNRTAIGIASILLALIISFGVTPLIDKAVKSQVEIVRATKDIKAGEEITSDKLTKVKVGGYNLPQGVIRSSNDLIGKYALTDIYKDDYFLSSKVSDIKTRDDNYLYSINNQVQEENMAVSVTIKTLASGLSGKLKAGDIVSIISSNDNSIMPTIVPELRYVEVLSISTKEGKDIDSVKEELPATITLSVNAIQAEKLVEHEQAGNIHIALVYRGDKKEASKYLEMQKEYISPPVKTEEKEAEEGEKVNEGLKEINNTQVENTNNTEGKGQ